MKAHTPGPWIKAERLNGPWWHISANHSVGGELCKQGRQAIATVHGESKRGAKAYAEMFEANARLIAAAPDLLMVLQDLQESAIYWSEYDVPLGIVARINAAIAKATGAEA